MSSMKTTPDRDKPVTIKLSKQEKRQLEAVCKSCGASKSTYFRSCIARDYAYLLSQQAPVLKGVG